MWLLFICGYYSRKYGSWQYCSLKLYAIHTWKSQNKSPNVDSTRGLINVLTPVENIPKAIDRNVLSTHSRNELQRQPIDRVVHSLHKSRAPPKRQVRTRHTHASDRKTITPKPRSSKVSPVQANSVISSDFKIPKPSLGHSTPSTTSAYINETPTKMEDSLFGFDALSTPCPLTSVFPEIDEFNVSKSMSNSPDQSPIKSASFQKVNTVYSVPSHHPRKLRKKSEWVS